MEEKEIPLGLLKEPITSRKERKRIAQKFVESLSSKPPHWKVGGSTARGDFRPDSDIDVIALYKRDEDIPWVETFQRQDEETGLIDGVVDFHPFAEDWLVFQEDPQLLNFYRELFQ